MLAILILNDKYFSRRWKELSRRIESWIEIHELNEQGFYSPVELLQREGLYQNLMNIQESANAEITTA